jgi:hypothetical protein
MPAEGGTRKAEQILMAEVEAEGGQLRSLPSCAGILKRLLYDRRPAWNTAGLAGRASADPQAGFVQLGVLADASGESSPVPMTADAVCPREVGFALAERVEEIKIRSAGWDYVCPPIDPRAAFYRLAAKRAARTSVPIGSAAMCCSGNKRGPSSERPMPGRQSHVPV